MYVRNGKTRDETWLRNGIEAMGLGEATGEPQEYVIAVEEGADKRAGFGRLCVHDGSAVGELTNIGVDGNNAVVALAIDPENFEMPSRLREAFKTASGAGETPTVDAEEFGIDADRATYKYDTGR